MNILYGKISDMAKETFADPVNSPERWVAWLRHWIETANQLHDECMREGLLDTATDLGFIIDQVSYTHRKDLERAA